MNSCFYESGEPAWRVINKGMKRQILAFDKDIMIVMVKFSKNAVGAIHQHVHSQATYVLSGIFEVTVDNEKKILRAGDCFIVPKNSLHGAVCRQAGILIDVFSPAREDFLI